VTKKEGLGEREGEEKRECAIEKKGERETTREKERK